jgi:hypothetical protein
LATEAQRLRGRRGSPAHRPGQAECDGKAGKGRNDGKRGKRGKDGKDGKDGKRGKEGVLLQYYQVKPGWAV